MQHLQLLTLIQQLVNTYYVFDTVLDTVMYKMRSCLKGVAKLHQSYLAWGQGKGDGEPIFGWWAASTYKAANL